MAGADQAETVGRASPLARELMTRYWPGALTIIVAARPDAPLAPALAGTTVGLRAPDHRFLLALMARVGPLATTSANRHGHPTPTAAGAAAASLGGPVELIVDGGRCAGAPSSVVDLTGAEPRVVRAGAVAIDG